MAYSKRQVVDRSKAPVTKGSIDREMGMGNLAGSRSDRKRQVGKRRSGDGQDPAVPRAREPVLQ